MKSGFKKALITGGSGFIGSHLCEELLSRGFKVCAVDNFTTSTKDNIKHLLKNKNFTFYKGTILNRSLMKRLVKDCDIIYHLAAAVGVRYILEHPVESILTNLNGTEIMLELANLHKKKFIFTSTSEVYGKHACAVFGEEDDRLMGATTISRWSYAEGKAIDEFITLAYVKERKLKAVIVRLFNTVGPRQTGRYGMVVPRFIQQALKNIPITVYGSGKQSRSFTYVKDVVKAMVNLSLSARAYGKVFNIGNDKPISIEDLALKIKEKTGSHSSIKYISYRKAFGNNHNDFEDMQCRIPKLTKIKQAIKYSPKYGIDDIIDITTSYFRAKMKI